MWMEIHGNEFDQHTELNSKTSWKPKWKSGALVVQWHGFRLLVCLPVSGVLLMLFWSISVHNSLRGNLAAVDINIMSQRYPWDLGHGGWGPASGISPPHPPETTIVVVHQEAPSLTMVQGHLIPYGSQCPACSGLCIPPWMCVGSLWLLCCIWF